MLRQVKLAALGLVAASAILPMASPASAAFSKNVREAVTEIQTEIPEEELIARRYRTRKVRIYRRRPRRHYRIYRRYHRYHRPRFIRRRTCYRTRRYRTRNGYRYKTVCSYRNYRRY